MLHNEKRKEKHGNYININGFSENRHMVHPHNSGSILRIYFFLILHNERSQEYMKILLVVFQEKISFWAIRSF